ncbi:hypothetical protein NHH03_17375 [Stieleria sp. TO1_6]|uniref:hypothetical protein n=1 Tax=Stieleria tagensis TaxID=2956795 RepID=UPI00209AFADC|nr:hypothetical protein [Stieleria tagensis]MCO8123522.1 hypothetical protein [Stieleria tagensis]
MIELERDALTFSFPEVHPQATLRIEFQRTLRIPDDDRTYPLPPGLGAFPMRHVDDHAANVPSKWLQRGGVMLPMYQSEAMWLNFSASTIQDRGESYPFAIKVATGKQCAVSGEAWRDDLRRKPQNYMIAPQQPWLDGYVVEKGLIRQFVAMPLGAGYSAEEQITGKAEHGGLQLAVYPMKRDIFERRFPKVSEVKRSRGSAFLEGDDAGIHCCLSAEFDMALAPGGRMRQEIFDDPFELDDWNLDAGGRCFVHLCNSMVWQSITGTVPPHPAPTAKSYTAAGLPWFDYYDDSGTAVEGTSVLGNLKSITQMSSEKGDVALPENETVTPGNLVVYRKGLKQGQVRESVF